MLIFKKSPPAGGDLGAGKEKRDFETSSSLK
jgi:hypothetical protein